MRRRQILGLGRRKPKVIKFETRSALEEWLIQQALITQRDHPGHVNEHLRNILILREWVHGDTGELTDFGKWEAEQAEAQYPDNRQPLHKYWNENTSFVLLIAGFIATLTVLVALMIITQI